MRMRMRMEMAGSESICSWVERASLVWWDPSQAAEQQNGLVAGGPWLAADLLLLLPALPGGGVPAALRECNTTVP